MPKSFLAHVCLTTIVTLGLGRVVFYADEPDLNRENLQGKWLLVTVDGVAIPDQIVPFFEVNGDEILGFDGCNKYENEI